MANIIDNLLISGAIMKGSFFQKLQNDFSDVIDRRKAAKKAQSEMFQTKAMRRLYKDWLIQKHKPECVDEHATCFLSWEQFTTC